MKTSSRGIELIKEFEGCRLEAYKCPAGVWTIGYGHTGTVLGVKVGSGMKITDSHALKILKTDLCKFENAVSDIVKIKLNQNQFDALVSFTYNCGAGNLKTLVKNRTAEQISEALLLYNKAFGKVLAGLTRRRKAEQALFINE
jgi:GH24 family phage-related lysozyme (muramidase)